MSAETPDTAADPLLDRNATVADLGTYWATLASKPGTVEAGRVTAVDDETVTVAVAAGEGRVARAELDRDAAPPAVGDTLRVFIEQVLAAGPVLSARKARALDLFDRLEAAADRDDPVDGLVLARVKGGLSVDVGLKAFLPDNRAAAPVGEAGRFWVRGWDERKDMFVLAREPRTVREARKSAKAARAEAAASPEGTPEAAPATPRELPPEGAVVTGRVVRLADFGAFVDLPGGATGLLHVKDMGWGRIQHPGDAVRIGDEVEVKVLKIQPGEGKGEKIQLSRRALLPEPWSTAGERLAVGQRVSGPVISLAEYGAFVEVEPGIEGLVHVSELGWGAVPKHPKEALKPGQRIEAEIILLDLEKKHLKLSMKRLQPSPWATLREKFPVGSRVRGKVKNVASFGVFVTMDEVSGIDGLVHLSDLSWTPVHRPGEAFPPGTEVEALVLGIDEERGRCSLGLKQLQPEPERPSLAAYAVGQTLEGRIARVKDFGAFVELAPGIEGLLHANEMGLAEGQKARDKVKPGETVSVTIASLDPEARRIGLVLNAPAEPPAG